MAAPSNGGTRYDANTSGSGTRLGSREIEELIDLPLMTDPDVDRDPGCSDQGIALRQFSRTRTSTPWSSAGRSISVSSTATTMVRASSMSRLAPSGACFGDYQDGISLRAARLDLVEKRGLEALQGRDLPSLRQSHHAVDEASAVACRSVLRQAFEAAQENRRPHVCGV